MDLNLTLDEQYEILLVLRKRIKALDVVISSDESLGLSSDHHKVHRDICLSAIHKISSMPFTD